MPWDDANDHSCAGAATAGGGANHLSITLGPKPLAWLFGPVPTPLTAATTTSTGRRCVPLAAVLKVLAEYGSAARALQQAEAAATTVAGPEEYRALWPLMRRGRKCAMALMVLVER